MLAALPATTRAPIPTVRRIPSRYPPRRGKCCGLSCPDRYPSDRNAPCTIRLLLLVSHLSPTAPPAHSSKRTAATGSPRGLASALAIRSDGTPGTAPAQTACPDPAPPPLQAASWIRFEVAKKLVEAAGLDLDKLFEQAQSREFHPIELPVHLQARVASQLRPFVSRNVLAALLGRDATLRAEAVLYTAHYDHLGIDPDKKDHNIYHGAVDNATGCGVLLELARAWSQVTPPASPRTILFAAVTAEEQGLLGSEYLGMHSPVPPGKISLDLNYDALAPIGDPEEVEVGGAERTTFYPT